MSSFQPVAISLPRCTTTAPASSKPIPRKSVFGSTKHTRQMQREDRVAEDRAAENRDSEFRIQRRQSPKDDSDGSKQYPNNTKTAVAVATARRVAVGAIRGATKGRVTEPITAAEHTVGASGWALWVVSAG